MGPRVVTPWSTLLQARRAAVPDDTTALRWVDFEQPDITVDLFGDVAVLSLYRAHTVQQEQALADALRRAAPLRAVYLKRRPREARREANEAAEQVAPVAPLWGAPVPSLTVREAGAAFEIRPANGLSVGLYLDARDARRWVAAHARGQTVLNLFAYTCGFGVAARVGGARRVLNVDRSRKVLDWGEANERLNGFQPDRHDFVAGDAFEWLRRLAKKGERFELVVVDPPSFASHGGERFSAAKDYPALIAAAAQVVVPGGRLLACCNLAGADDAQLAAWVLAGAPRATVLERFGASAADHAQPSALKVIVARL